MTTPVPDGAAQTGATAPLRPPLQRAVKGRWVAGVAAGVAAHLQVDVRLVRAAFVVATAIGGAGALGYVFWWVTLPDTSGPRAGNEPPAALARLAKPLREARTRRLRAGDAVVALGLLAVAAILLASRLGERPAQSWLIPVLLLVTGTVLTWGELNARRTGEGSGRVRTLRLVGGIAIAATAIVLLVGQRAEPVVVMQSALAAVAVLSGVALVLAPWWLRLVRELGDARAERERESERADIAAHLHDSVLQTLALIKSRSTEPEVVRLARAQERDLRTWLYEDRAPEGTSLAAALHEIIAEVEDTRTHADGSAPDIDTVVVGDTVPDEETRAVLAATREALLNAVVHGAPPVSVYFEADDDGVEVFVRDHGAGFSPADVPTDRFGVRESIIGRLRRRGGEATITGVPDGGTEVRLYLPRHRGEHEHPEARPEPQPRTEAPSGPPSGPAPGPQSGPQSGRPPAAPQTTIEEAS